MILIDSSFWSTVGVISSNGNPNGNQYGFYNSIDMSNTVTIYNQYEFFKNSPINGVYYNNQYEWYKAIGVFHSEPIFDQYSFYQNVTFDGVNKVGNQYNFFKFLTAAISGDFLQGIFTTYNFTNMWSSENLTISGTTTTLNDYSGEHNLTNPAAASQASFNASSASFNSKPSLTYDGTDDLNYKSVSNWRGSDASGVMIGVYRTIGGFFNTFLMTGDESTNNYFALNRLQGNSLRFGVKSVTPNTFYGTSNINDGLAHIASYSSNGSAYNGIVDGVDESLTALEGSNNGDWLGGSPTQRDNILVGGFKTATSVFSNIEWVMSGYLPYVSVVNIISLQNELKAYYGI